MSSVLIDVMRENVPPVNPEVMNGLAVSQMKDAEEYVDRVFKSASKSFPKGIVYKGYEKCTPFEEYEVTTKKRNNKRSVDIARADIYLVKYFFEFNGEPLPPSYIYLPFVTDGGIFYLGNAQYHLTPVLSDKVISSGIDNIFVRLLRDKIIFRRIYHTIIVNGERIAGYVIWSQIYRKQSSTRKTREIATTKAVTSLAHYLFCKFGVTETFKKYAGFEPIIGDEEVTRLKDSDDYIICESTGLKPKSYIEGVYVPNGIKMAIPKENWNPLTQALVYGFFYVVDHFPTRIVKNHINNTAIWKILLGSIIFSGVYSENKLFLDVEAHFDSLNNYVDTIVIEKLRENNFYIEDFYDLLALLLGNFNYLIATSTESTTSMFGKSLDVRYHAMYSVTSGIFKLVFKLSKEASKRPLDINRIKALFNAFMKMGSAFALASNSIASEPVSYSGDHKYPKFGSKISEQEGSYNSNQKAKQTTSINETHHINMSRVESGSMLMMSKSNPTPNVRLNMYVNIDNQTNTIIPNEKLKDTREKTDKLLKGVSV